MRQRMKKWMIVVVMVILLGALLWSKTMIGVAGFGDYNDYDYQYEDSKDNNGGSSIWTLLLRILIIFLCLIQLSLNF